MDANSTSKHDVRAIRKRIRVRIAALSLGFFLGISMQMVMAGPTGGEVINGQGTIGQDGSITSIDQLTQRLVLEWQTFDVSANEQVVFNQPGTSAIALNRIFDQNASQILGAVNANGKVFLINPNGIVFGTTATVNVAALVATSLDLNYNDFMDGNYDFQVMADGSPGVVINRGLLRAATGGSVTLMGDAVANEGLIIAELGQVTLASGKRASLDFDGDGLLFFDLDCHDSTGPFNDAGRLNPETVRRFPARRLDDDHAVRVLGLAPKQCR